jgi:hypothetical protein
MERSQDIEDEDTMTFFGGSEGDADESQEPYRIRRLFV